MRQGGSAEKAQGLLGPLLYASSKDAGDVGTWLDDKGGEGHLLGLGELKITR